MDDDIQILTLPYNNDLYAINRKTNNLKIIILLVLHAILIIANWMISLVFPWQRNEFVNNTLNESNLVSSYNLSIYSQIILWLISLIIKDYMKKIYYKRLRILGYNNHYHKVQLHVSLSSFLLHIANGLILLSNVLFNHMDVITIHNFHIKPMNVLQAIITIVSIPILININIHLFLEIKFRRNRNPPDVFCIDDPSSRLTSDGLNQVAIRSSSFLEDLLENQADLIYNLKLQNSHLRELLFKATNNHSNDDAERPTNAHSSSSSTATN